MTTLLGGLTPAQFLEKHWQKKPLLVRQAIPGFRGFVDVDDLLALARRDDVVARSVALRGGRHRLQKGPLKGPPPGQGPWTVLVQGIETLHPEGWPLLRRFDDVVPRARLDDLMISWASEGAGVGPHTDRYDVFLLQGPGRRRWRLQHTPDPRLDERAEVPILARFKHEVEYILEPGDMLYLPPGVAHDGTAVDGPCLTYSIGAVAPSVEALQQNWLGYLSQQVEAKVDLKAMYEDRDLTVSSSPVEIGDAMVARVEQLLLPVRQTTRDDVEEFLGRLLTGPKPHVVFPPTPKLSRGELLQRLTRPESIGLALPSRGLVRGRRVFLNGETAVVDDAGLQFWSTLVRERRVLGPVRIGGAGLEFLLDAFAKGHVRFEGASSSSSSSSSSGRRRR
jgi:50S ribosomal protein L16 3-hydroxylase